MLVFLFICALVTGVSDALNIREDEIEYLERFGYIDNSGPAAQRTEEFLKEKIREFQEMAALPTTGEMDDATRRMMTRPRCGRKDRLEKERFRRHHHHRSRRRAVRYTSKWPKHDLTFWIKNVPRSVPDRDAIRREVLTALGAWQDVTELKFTETKSQKNGRDVDIAISFERGQHDDAYAFNGGDDPVLAHAFPFYPYGHISGDAHFNADKNFQLGAAVSAERNARFGEINFRSTAIHEFGHSLGLEHSSEQESIMFAYYDHNRRGEPRLSRLDVYNIQSMYGANRSPKLERPTPTTTTTTTVAPPPQYHEVADEGNHEMVLPDPCGARIGAATMIRNELFMFQDAWFWRFHKGQLNGRPTLISSFYRDLPYPIDAAVEINDKIYFFVGKNVHIYHGMRKLEMKPLKALGLPTDLQKVRLAFRWKFGNQISYYIWSQHEYWKLDVGSMEVEVDYPRKLSSFWKDVPEDVDAAFDTDDGLFFLSKDQVHEFDGVRAKTLPPTPIIQHFEYCKKLPYNQRLAHHYEHWNASSGLKSSLLLVLLTTIAVNLL